MIGCGRGYGQVVTLRLESVLIGRPDDADDGSIRSWIRVDAAGCSSGCLRSDLLLLAALLQDDAVLRFKTFFGTKLTFEIFKK